MPKDEISTDDPLDLVGCEVDCDASDTLNMARCFAEEYFFIDWTGQQILEMFENPFYRGPHTVYQCYGEDWVKSLINDVAESLRERHQKRSGS